MLWFFTCTSGSAGKAKEPDNPQELDLKRKVPFTQKKYLIKKNCFKQPNISFTLWSILCVRLLLWGYSLFTLDKVTSFIFTLFECPYNFNFCVYDTYCTTFKNAICLIILSGRQFLIACHELLLWIIFYSWYKITSLNRILTNLT